MVTRSLKKNGRRFGASSNNPVMQILSKEFVMGVDFDSVLKQGNLKSAVHSFDMLGEAARSKQQSQNFFNAYYQET